VTYPRVYLSRLLLFTSTGFFIPTSVNQQKNATHNGSSLNAQ